MLTVGYGVLVFTGMVLALVAILLAVQARLSPSGEVRIVINRDAERALRARAGQTLLNALAEHAVLLPSACGGKGTCGACRVVVRAGAGAPLVTERAHIGRRDAAAGVRLACQVKLRGDLEIEVPAEILAVRRRRCRVRSSRCVATYIKEIVLDLPQGEVLEFRAGAYVQIDSPPHRVSFRDFDIAPEYRDEWQRYDLWRHESVTESTVQRAYSMANYPGEGGVITLNVRIALPPPGAEEAPPGQCSSYLFALRPGDEVVVAGPFGDFFARDGEREMCLVGGGAGMAPLRSILFDQLERLGARRAITFWYGARSRREAFYVDELDALARRHENFSWRLALSEARAEDHWTGPSGFIHQVLYEQYLEHHPAPEEIEYYLCGPPAMLDACRAMLSDLGVEAENIFFDDFGS